MSENQGSPVLTRLFAVGHHSSFHFLQEAMFCRAVASRAADAGTYKSRKYPIRTSDVWGVASRAADADTYSRTCLIRTSDVWGVASSAADADT